MERDGSGGMDSGLSLYRKKEAYQVELRRQAIGVMLRKKRERQMEMGNKWEEQRNNEISDIKEFENNMKLFGNEAGEPEQISEGDLTKLAVHLEHVYFLLEKNHLEFQVKLFMKYAVHRSLNCYIHALMSNYGNQELERWVYLVLSSFSIVIQGIFYIKKTTFTTWKLSKKTSF